LIIIWEKALDKEVEILNYLSKKFELIKKLEITWNSKNIGANFSRFYGENLPEGSFKEKHCGSGKFLALIVEDQKPLHGLRKTSKGTKIVNTNIFDCKQLFREWTGGGHKIHASDDETESRKDIALLLGIDIKKDLNLISKYNDTLTQDLIGTNGWASFDEIFYILNATTNYAVLRNAEEIGPSLFESVHPDIDLLVENVEEAKYILNVTNVFPEEYRVHFVNFVGKDKVYWDLRSPNDGYMSQPWCGEILKHKEVDNSGRYIPSLDNLFWSRIYHALVHKNSVSQDYILKTLDASELIFGHRVSILSDTNEALIELASYMALNGYDCPTPRDKSVPLSQNTETLIELIKVFSRFLGLFKSTYPLTNLVKFKEIILIETSFITKLRKIKLFFYSIIFQVDISAQNTINTTVSNKSIYFALEPITRSNWFNFKDIVSRGSENNFIFYSYQIRNPRNFLESQFQFRNFRLEELLIFNHLDKIKLAITSKMLENINSPWIKEKIFDESYLFSKKVQPREKYLYLTTTNFQSIEDISIGSIVHISEKKEDRLNLTTWWQNGDRRLPFNIINRILDNNNLIVKSVPLVDSVITKQVSEKIFFNLKSETYIANKTLWWDLVEIILDGREILTFLKETFKLFDLEVNSTHNSKIARSDSDTRDYNLVLNNSFDLHLGNVIVVDKFMKLLDLEFTCQERSMRRISKLRMLILTIHQISQLKLLSVSKYAEILDLVNSILISNFTENEIIKFIELEALIQSSVNRQSNSGTKGALLLGFTHKSNRTELSKEFYLATYSATLQNDMNLIKLSNDLSLSENYMKIKDISHELSVNNAILIQELNSITNSRSWKIITLYRKLKSKIF
jgi:hypothetical protein